MIWAFTTLAVAFFVVGSMCLWQMTAIDRLKEELKRRCGLHDEAVAGFRTEENRLIAELKTKNVRINEMEAERAQILKRHADAIQERNAKINSLELELDKREESCNEWRNQAIDAEVKIKDLQKAINDYQSDASLYEAAIAARDEAIKRARLIKTKTTARSARERCSHYWLQVNDGSKWIDLRLTDGALKEATRAARTNAKDNPRALENLPDVNPNDLQPGQESTAS